MRERDKERGRETQSERDTRREKSLSSASLPPAILLDQSAHLSSQQVPEKGMARCSGESAEREREERERKGERERERKRERERE